MKKNQDDNNKNDRKILIGLTILFMILIVAIICTTFLIKNKDDKKDTELAYTDLINKGDRRCTETAQKIYDEYLQDKF